MPWKPKPPYKPNSPTNPNELQFTVYYYVELGQNHMWVDYEPDSDKIILIDKENPIFSNDELTKKNRNYTITFLAQDAEKYHNRDHVYYFSKNNNKFSLKPEQKQSERKFEYVVKQNNYHIFRAMAECIPCRDWRVIYVDQNHLEIKRLLSEGKLQEKKLFTIRYGKADKEIINLYLIFNENNQELEIIEA